MYRCLIHIGTTIEDWELDFHTRTNKDEIKRNVAEPSVDRQQHPFFKITKWELEIGRSLRHRLPK